MEKNIQENIQKKIQIFLCSKNGKKYPQKIQKNPKKISSKKITKKISG